MVQPDAGAPLWIPSAEAVHTAPVMAFARWFGDRVDEDVQTTDDLHRLSVERPEAFWTAVWDWCGVVGDRSGPVTAGHGMPGTRFFPEARINFAENLLRRADDGEAIVFNGEGRVRRALSWRELGEAVGRFQQVLAAAGVGAGDRVAAMMPNMPETIVAMLATAALGGVFSSCSPDFGERGVLDRFGQIEPKVLVVCDGYWYAGKRIAVADKIGAIIGHLPTLKAVFVADYLGEAEAVAAGLPLAAPMSQAMAAVPARPPIYRRMPFNAPLYILFSSGTTGVPKCIVHGVGGTLLQHLKEQRLHCGIGPADRFFYFTTCGWMMWNWLVSGLASDATLLLYDGSPLATNEILFDYAAAEGMTVFGTSAKFIDGVRKTGWEPRTTHDLSSLRLMLSTGSPLSADGFDFVYSGIKADMHLASISGGTDIVSCFVGGDPTKPVHSGEIQAPGLGMAVEVWTDAGVPAEVGVKGELVCVKPFPSMPVMFWNDPDGAKYHAAYFDRFPNVWCHGDFAEWTANGGMVIHGRSDATLNPGGVRIGTAEIYAQVERVPEVLEALAIGQDWDNDVRVVLFVRTRPEVVLDEALTKRLKTAIREGASPRHVPAVIVPVADIPRTKSGKITELAVREVVHGRPVKNREALANPEALELFKDLPQLR